MSIQSVRQPYYQDRSYPTSTPDLPPRPLATPAHRNVPRPVRPRDLPPDLAAEKRGYQEHVRQLQSINRFQRKRAVADQLLLPARGLFAFIPIPVPFLQWLGIGFPIGLQKAHVNTHEGRDPARMRKHLFESETSRRQSSKIVEHLAQIGVLDKTYHYVRPISEQELAAIQDKYNLQDEATAKISWALEVFPQISAEANHERPSRYAAALPRG
jgi:hypothetical protein